MQGCPSATSRACARGGSLGFAMFPAPRPLTVFSGHSDFVADVCATSPQSFASVSLDETLLLWDRRWVGKGSPQRGLSLGSGCVDQESGIPALGRWDLQRAMRITRSFRLKPMIVRRSSRGRESRSDTSHARQCA